jgi:DNA-binding NtrC family response regulator
LLRAVETRMFPVLGGDDRPFTARLIAATHQPLDRLIREDRFRQDLYYRLAVLELELPPLRARREDIPSLAAHFIDHYAGRLGRPAPKLSAAAARYLSKRAYPGNIRELAHLIERAIVMQDAAVLEQSAFTDARGGGAEDGVMLTVAAYHRTRDHLERNFVESLLQTHQGGVAAAAKAAGMSRAYLYQLVKRHFPDQLAPVRRKRR